MPTDGAGMPISTIVPPRRDSVNAWSNVAVEPTQSRTVSTPTPAVSSAMAAATSSAPRVERVRGAAALGQRTARRRRGRRRSSGWAPFSRAPCVAHRPDAAGPDHEHAVAGLDRRQVERRAGPGDDGAPDQRQLLGRQVGVHGHHRPLGDDDGVGERAEPGRPADRLAAGAEPVEPDVRRRRAQVWARRGRRSSSDRRSGSPTARRGRRRARRSRRHRPRRRRRRPRGRARPAPARRGRRSARRRRSGRSRWPRRARRRRCAPARPAPAPRARTIPVSRMTTAVTSVAQSRATSPR